MSNKESVTNKAGDCPNDQRDQRSQPSTAENLALGQLPCSLLVECTEDEQTFTARLPHNRLRVWKGRDVWHQDVHVHVQVRLEPDGRIYLSTQEGHVSTLRSATITIEDFYTLIRGVTANDIALAQPPGESAGDTAHAQIGAGAGTESEGGCCQQRLVLPVGGVFVPDSVAMISMFALWLMAAQIGIGLGLLLEQLWKLL